MCCSPAGWTVGRCRALISNRGYYARRGRLKKSTQRSESNLLRMDSRSLLLSFLCTVLPCPLPPRHMRVGEQTRRTKGQDHRTTHYRPRARAMHEVRCRGASASDSFPVGPRRLQLFPRLLLAGPAAATPLFHASCIRGSPGSRGCTPGLCIHSTVLSVHARPAER